MKVFIVDEIWQLDNFFSTEKNNLEKFIFVSLNPECSYFLKKKNIPFFETSDLCIHKDLWSKYYDINNLSFKLCETLNDSLFKLDKRFKDLNWPIFDDLHYVLKVSYDTLYYHAELISKIIQKFDPEELIIGDNDKLKIDENFLISTESSVINHLLTSIDQNIGIRKLHNKDIVNKKDSKFPFGQPRYLLNNQILKKKIFSLYHKIKFNIQTLSNKKYLGIGTYEIIALKKLYPEMSKDFLVYYHDTEKLKLSLNKKKFIKDFIKEIQSSKDYNILMSHENLKFNIFFEKIFYSILSVLDFYLDEYKNAKKILKKIKPKTVIFQSMSSFYYPNITFRKACIDLQIPYATWVHGGYFTKSLPGYDVVDYRFCNNHIGYGKYLKELICSKKTPIENFSFNKKYSFFSGGSFRFELDNKNLKAKKINISKNKKKKILFATGSVNLKNQFYFGYNREKAETSLWELHFEIIKILADYKNYYDVVIKDYPYGPNNLWKSVINDLNSNIKIITTEKTIKDLLIETDLSIFPWISTTFFESLYHEQDVFLLEEDLFVGSFIKDLKNEIYFSNNFIEFKKNLIFYLNEGIFYKRSKNLSKNYFLNFNCSNEKKIKDLKIFLNNLK